MIRFRRVLAGLSVLGAAGWGYVTAVTPADAAPAPVDFVFTGATQTYSVPGDSSVCSLTVDLAGANGGQAGFNGTLGSGGSASATVAVTPGATVSVDVGGVGTSTSSSTTTGGTGGFGGGASGGDAAGVAGAGGGGATTVKVDGAVVLVAGGGGGGGGQTADGGDGGSSGGAGTDGQTNVGIGGGGGTPTAGGTGGAANGAGTTAGADGTAGTGGAGGLTTNSNAGGGGGGGGGYFGGGGGGGAPGGSSGGGGGGGSGFADPATTSGVSTGTVTQDGSGNGAAQITPAGGCPPILTINKVVTGDVPSGTTFTVHVQCSHASQTTVDEDVTFDAAGNPVSGNPTIAAALTDTCNVTETASGGAQSVSYACSDNAGTAPAHCQSTNQDVQFGRTLGETATVTVTNTFPQAPPPVNLTPRFTG